MNVRHRLALVVLGAALLAGACGKEPEQVSAPTGDPAASGEVAQDAGSQVSLVRVVNAVPSEPATDVLVGGGVAFNRVAYGDVTPYRVFQSDAVTFQLRPSVPDSSKPIAQSAVRLGAGKHYTLLAMPTEAGGATLSLLVDEVAPPAEGKAGLRVVNASPGPASLDVGMRGAPHPLVSDGARSVASAFVDVAPLHGTLEVRSAGALRAHVPEAELEAGNRYTVLLLRQPSRGEVRLAARLIDEPAAPWPES